MFATIYERPDGRKREVELVNVYPADEEWFTENEVAISLEDLGPDIVIYADVGLRDQDGEPAEITTFVRRRTCEDTLHELRLRCEELLKGA